MKIATAVLAALLPASLLAEFSVLECARLVDPQAREVRQDQLVLIDADRIVAVGSAADIDDELESRGAGAVSVRRHTLSTCLPGLMDMHVHLRHQNSPDHYLKRFVRSEADSALIAAHFARITLDAGFTTVRDLGDGQFETVALRNAIDQGMAQGPRIYAVGKSIGTTGGHADPTNGYRPELMGDPGPNEGVINSPEDARKAVRYRYKRGADYIKITATGGVLSLAKSGQNPQFTQEEANAIVATAREYGMGIAAHAHGAEGMKRAVLAGVSSIEHGTFMTPEIMELMKSRGTFFVPTLLAGKFVGEKARVDGYFPEVVRPKAAAIGPQMRETVAQAIEAGVPIAFGTDSGVSAHGDNAQEFALLVEAGLSTMDAIRTATTHAAQLLGEEERLGRIAPGYFADIVAVDGDPLEDITELERVRWVIKGGDVIRKP